jgi:poly-gamma-glutamate synthesis protein (capsule biosynthesis protein)
MTAKTRAGAILFSAAVFGAALWLAVRTPMADTGPSGDPAGTASLPAESLPESLPIPPTQPVQVELCFAGDNLIHDVIYWQASARTGGTGYDFSPVYRRVKPLFDGADIVFVNQETPLAGELYPLSGYPRFNSPSEVADALAGIGCNLANVANNHMFDKGEEGLLATLDSLRGRDIVTVGAWRSEAEMEIPVVAAKGGLRIAFVGMTEHTNGLTLSGDTPMRYLLCEEEALIQQQLTRARLAADVVVVSVHWGFEGVGEENEFQRELAQKLADWGADVIVGHHSHTLQPMEFLTRADGGQTLVVYSLGNFVSAQKGAANMLGGVLRLVLTRESPEAPVQAAEVRLYPVVTHYGRGMSEVEIYPFTEYTPELAAAHGVRAYDGRFGYKYLQEKIKGCVPAAFLSEEVKALL